MGINGTEFHSGRVEDLPVIEEGQQATSSPRMTLEQLAQIREAEEARARIDAIITFSRSSDSFHPPRFIG